jgi:hypothetical protein
VLNGELEYAKFNKDSILAASEEVGKIIGIRRRIELRNEVAKRRKKHNFSQNRNK